MENYEEEEEELLTKDQQISPGLLEKPESEGAGDGDGVDRDYLDTDAEELEYMDEGGTGSQTEQELELIKARVREMEEEAEKLKLLQSEVDRQMNMNNSPGHNTSGTSGAGLPVQVNLSVEDKMEVDARSVYVGNVDYASTAEELEQHFHGCGSINRVTILCNKYDGHPKGFAYIEFGDRDSVRTAMAMDESLFRGRQIKVMPKRTNRPGVTRSDRPPRGGLRGRGRARGGFFLGAPRYPRRGYQRGPIYFSPY